MVSAGEQVTSECVCVCVCIEAKLHSLREKGATDTRWRHQKQLQGPEVVRRGEERERCKQRLKTPGHTYKYCRRS